jgi:FixJ family two-component response regulator
MVRLSNTPVISIVDDDESVRTAMRDMVESFGYAVVAFASGVEFLGSSGPHDSACLIADVRMPGMDGLELQSRLIASGQAIPTIFMTAFPEKKAHDRAMEAGAIAYLSKPCRRHDLLTHIRMALASGTLSAS